MARQYVVSNVSSPFAITTGAKTILELTAATYEFVIVEIDVTFNGTTASAVPVLVDLCRVANTCTGASSPPAPVGLREGMAAASTTVKWNATVEGASPPAAALGWYVPPTSGLVVQYPLGREPNVVTSGHIIALRANAPASVTVVANITIEE